MTNSAQPSSPQSALSPLSSSQGIREQDLDRFPNDLAEIEGVFGWEKSLRVVSRSFGRTKPVSALFVSRGCSSTRSSRLDPGSVRLDDFGNSIWKTV
jgi:hypothetical protein